MVRPMVDIGDVRGSAELLSKSGCRFLQQVMPIPFAVRVPLLLKRRLFGRAHGFPSFVVHAANGSVTGPRIDSIALAEQDRIKKKRTRAAPVHAELGIVVGRSQL